MKNFSKTFVFIMLSGCFFASCDSYLDVVPDNIATIDHAFSDRNQAEKYLYTLYSYLPKIGNESSEGRFDDFTWSGKRFEETYHQDQILILRYGDRVSSPYCNYWEGGWFQAIRDCNIFLEKVDQVRDLETFEKIRWIAEAKFLKAYYHFLLLQKYGPIPIVDVNLPVAASDDEVMVERLPVDIVFEYVFRLLDEATPNLPQKIENVALEMGRITQSIALSVKAKIAVTSASPLFNGNTTYAAFKDRHGQSMFSAYSHDKWTKAVEACKQAIDMCHLAGHGLYEYNSEGSGLSNETQKIIQVGRIMTDKWNKEHVWGMTWGTVPGWTTEQYLLPSFHVDHFPSSAACIAPTMKAAELFYSKNGVPIEEDKFYDYDHRYETVETTAADNKFVQTGVRTAQLHLNREYRFYGSIAFDGGWWYGLGRYNEDGQWPVNTKSGNLSGYRSPERYSCSGFWIKKLINMQNSFSGTNYISVRTNYPVLRLADLYLLYAEALNEHLDAPNAEVWEYVNQVRERAGLESVQDSWTKYSTNPDKFTTKLGMQDIIRQERSIELMFEGHRFYDLRRWNKAPTALTGSVKGWNFIENSVEDFYQVIIFENVLFTDREVLSPIPLSEMMKNHNLIQNPGW